MSTLFAALRELTHLEVGTRDLIDIALVVVVFYLLLTAVQGTRAVSMLWGISILVVEHDMSLVMGISDEIVVLDFGKKLAQGSPREIQGNKEVIAIYLGEEDA